MMTSGITVRLPIVWTPLNIAGPYRQHCNDLIPALLETDSAPGQINNVAV